MNYSNPGLAYTDSIGSGEYNIVSQSTKKVKKPGILDRWLFKRLQAGATFEKQQEEDSVMGMKQRISVERSSPSIDQPERALQFTVYTASGGRVIETRRYDRKTDRTVNGLYVITSDQDFGREIDKIITMEALK
jgi:hypothetical protein